MTGFREYAEEMPVFLLDADHSKRGRAVVLAYNEGGCNGVEIDLIDLMNWIKSKRPEFLLNHQ